MSGRPTSPLLTVLPCLSVASAGSYNRGGTLCRSGSMSLRTAWLSVWSCDGSFNLSVSPGRLAGRPCMCSSFQLTRSLRRGSPVGHISYSRSVATNTGSHDEAVGPMTSSTLNLRTAVRKKCTPPFLKTKKNRSRICRRIVTAPAYGCLFPPFSVLLPRRGLVTSQGAT